MYFIQSSIVFTQDLMSISGSHLGYHITLVILSP